MAGKNKQLTQRKCENVSQGKVREVEVSGRPHELVVEDDDAGGEVTQDSHDDEDAVDCGQWP